VKAPQQKMVLRQYPRVCDASLLLFYIFKFYMALVLTYRNTSFTLNPLNTKISQESWHDRGLSVESLLRMRIAQYVTFALPHPPPLLSPSTIHYTKFKGCLKFSTNCNTAGIDQAQKIESLEDNYENYQLCLYIFCKKQEKNHKKWR
jgi:hypothetical protein